MGISRNYNNHIELMVFFFGIIYQSEAKDLFVGAQR